MERAKGIALLGFMGAVGLVCAGCPGAGQTAPPEPVSTKAPATETSMEAAHPGAIAFPEDLSARIGDAVKGLPGDYVPRTKHLTPEGKALFTNRLILEKSPYLRQHAHNPVNWHSWGDEAFDLAKSLNRPVFLSIGYTTCHWCHVMEEESFEDLEIAAFLNGNYIPVKLDREERPDIDAVYMTAVNVLTGRGGWPMSVWLTPSREPFMAGTYFPPRDGVRGSRRGFLTLIQELHAEFNSDPVTVAARASQLAAKVRAASQRRGSRGQVPDTTGMHNARQRYEQMFDSDYGGFGRGNKFPRSANLDFLLRYFRRTGHEGVREIVVKTLDAMKDGGLYDHVDHGFHRYTTERRFRIPHFEKMLYDNAQLVVTYLEAFQALGDSRYAEIARQTLDYVIRDMTSSDGGFYSATDADSEGEEGIFAVWTPGQIDDAVGDRKTAELLKSHFNVTPRGNFEHHTTVLYTTRPVEAVGSELGMDAEETHRRFREGHAKMFDARQAREQPILDDKHLTAWSGLMISAFARGALVLDDPRYLSAAQRGAQFVLKNLLRKDGRLHRRFHSGEAKYDGVLDDYSYLIAGLLDLHEADGDEAWFQQAVALQTVVDTHFKDPAGGYFMTADYAEVLIARERPDYDGARPSGNSVTLLNLLRLHALTLDDEYRAHAELLLQSFAQALTGGSSGLPKLLCGLDFWTDRSIEIVIVRPPGHNDDLLMAVLREEFVPNRVLARVEDGKVSGITTARGKRSLEGKPTAYVCELGSCQRPTTDPGVFRGQLRSMRQPL